MRGPLLKSLLALLVLASLALPALAGSLWKQDIERMVGGDYVVGEIQSDLPVYPLYLQNPSGPDAKPELKGYAFETNDLTTVRGYSGRPINILVVIDLNGTFLSAQLLEQKEPLFVRGCTCIPNSIWGCRCGTRSRLARPTTRRAAASRPRTCGASIPAPSPQRRSRAPSSAPRPTSRWRG